MAIDFSNLTSSKDVSTEIKVRPAWRRRPCVAPRATKKKTDELLKKMDDYFNRCYDAGEHPTFCDVAGDAGFDSVTQMINHARRHGGATMRGISRAMTAIAAGYEEQAQEGSRHAITLLGMTPQFDSHEPAAQEPQRPFSPHQEVTLNISGIDRIADRGKELTPQEAYLQLIKHKTYEEIAGKALETEQNIEGDYSVVEIDED